MTKIYMICLISIYTMKNFKQSNVLIMTTQNKKIYGFGTGIPKDLLQIKTQKCALYIGVVFWDFIYFYTKIICPCYLSKDYFRNLLKIQTVRRFVFHINYISEFCSYNKSVLGRTNILQYLRVQSSCNFFKSFTYSYLGLL